MAQTLGWQSAAVAWASGVVASIHQHTLGVVCQSSNSESRGQGEEQQQLGQ